MSSTSLKRHVNESEVLAKRARVASLRDLNLSTCVKIKIMLKELEKNVESKNDTNDVDFYTRIFEDLSRVVKELGVISQFHYILVILDKHSNAKRKNLLGKHLNRQEIRNKCQKKVQTAIKNAAIFLQERAEEKQDLKDTFNARLAEYVAYESKFLKDTAVLEAKKELLKTEPDEQSDLNLIQDPEKSKEILNAISLQSSLMDELIAAREKKNQETFSAFDYYMKLKFMIDDADLACENLDGPIDEAAAELKAVSEDLSQIEHQEDMAKIEFETRENAYHAEMKRLNDLDEYLSENIQRADFDDKQARETIEQLKVSNVEAGIKISMLEAQRNFDKESLKDADSDSDSELEELDDEIAEIRAQIAALSAA